MGGIVIVERLRRENNEGIMIIGFRRCSLCYICFFKEENRL